MFFPYDSRLKMAFSVFFVADGSAKSKGLIKLIDIIVNRVVNYMIIYIEMQLFLKQIDACLVSRLQKLMK